MRLWGTLSTLQETNISPKNGIFDDDFPFPKVGYVNPLEGICLPKRSHTEATGPTAWSTHIYCKFQVYVCVFSCFSRFGEKRSRSIWVFFRKWWYVFPPQIIRFFNRDFRYKSSIFWVPLFWKHPYVIYRMQ